MRGGFFMYIMRKFILLAAIVLIACSMYCATCNPWTKKGSAVKELVAADMMRFHLYLRDTLLPLADGRAPITALQKSFLRARILYKSLEWATEYFMPTTSRFVNGPPLPEIENEEHKIFEPEGLQVVEELLYGGENIDYRELVRQVRLLQAHAATYNKYWTSIECTEVQVLDAIKLELFRVASLGITGFDAPVAKSGIKEAAYSLASLEKVLSSCFHEEWTEFRRAANFALTNSQFDRFNRALFIRNYLHPISIKLTHYQKKHTGFVNDKRLLKPSAPTLFAAGAFDLDAFAPDSSYYFTPKKRELGKRLFNDPILSGGGKRSCASCHNPQKAFTDGLRKSPSLRNGTLQRNAPTLLNAGLQTAQFYDMRTTNLENQSADVIANKDEMHGDMGVALSTLNTDKSYQRLIRQAFPGDKTFSEKELQNALATYIRSLGGLKSRFDRYMRGEDESLSRNELEGFNLFAGKAKCGTCHFIPLFNGTVPPLFTKMDSEVIGVPSNKHATSLDGDRGRYNIYQLGPYAHAF